MHNEAAQLSMWYSFSMTDLRIIHTLFWRKRKLRRRIVKLVKTWLVSRAIMRAMSKRLGYSVERLDSWVIV